MVMSFYEESEVIQCGFYKSRYQQIKINGYMPTITLRVGYRNKDNGLFVYGDDPQNIIYHNFETGAKTKQTFLKELDKFFDLVENHEERYQSNYFSSESSRYRYLNHPEKANNIKRIRNSKRRIPTKSELVAKLSNEKPKVYIKSSKTWYQDPFGKSPLDKALYGRHWQQEGDSEPDGVPYRVTETADLVKKWEKFKDSEIRKAKRGYYQ